MNNIIKGKILVVDDTPATIGILSETLESNGFQVFIATSGDKAIQRAENIRPDIILLDVMMPGIDGFETCAHLKSIDAIKDVPILFMTGLSAIESKVKGFQAGAVDYVTKPIEIDEVLSRIKTHIALKNAKRLLLDKNDQLQVEISERRTAEEKVRELNTNLEKRVLERTDELANVNRMLKMLSECNQTLVRALTEEELLEKICKILTEFGGYPFVQVGFFKDDSYRNIWLGAEVGQDRISSRKEINFSSEEILELEKTGFHDGELFISNSINDKTRLELLSILKNANDLKSSVLLPLIINKKLYGYLKIYSDQENSFLPEELLLLHELAGDLAFGIKLLKDRNELGYAEKELRENKILFDQVTAQSQVVVWSLDNHGIFKFVSETCQEVWGYSAEELVDTKKYLDLFQEEDKEHLRAFGAILRETQKTIRDNIYRILKKNGGMIWVSVSGFPIYNTEKEFIGYRGSIVNVTERQRMIDELIEAKKIAEEANRLKDSLLSNMSHEFRTPLNGILGFAQLLEDELNDVTSVEMARKITRSGKRLMNTLNAVLTLIELERKDFAISAAEADLVTICKQVQNSFQTLADEKKLDFVLDFETEEVPCIVDDSLLRKLLSYLVDNAIKYTLNGEVKVKVRRIVENNSEKFSVTVKDTGIGINKEDKALIFEEFRQASEGYKRAFEGIGLGLSLSRKISSLLGATISFESEFGVGSEFTITLPLMEVPARKTKPVSSSDFISRVEKNVTPANYEIMLIEDNLLNIEVIKRFLKKKGKLTYSQNGREAIELAAKNKYDLFLIDINLGHDIDGIEVLQELKTLDKYKTTPAVAITGYASENSKHEFLSKGFSRYLAKPFDKKELITVVDELMDETNY
jgi:PAS domain S-box-containing protein